MSYAMTLVGEISNFSAKIVISRYKKVFTTAYLRNEMRYFISAESYFAHQLLSENAAVKVAITLCVCFLPVCVCCMCPFLFHSVCTASLPCTSQWLLRHNQKALLNLIPCQYEGLQSAPREKNKTKKPLCY